MENQDAILWIVGQLFVAAAIWGGIRSDIKNMHSRIENVEKAVNDAHVRIDNHLDRGRTGHKIDSRG